MRASSCRRLQPQLRKAESCPAVVMILVATGILCPAGGYRSHRYTLVAMVGTGVSLVRYLWVSHKTQTPHKYMATFYAHFPCTYVEFYYETHSMAGSYTARWHPFADNWHGHLDDYTYDYRYQKL